MGQRLNLQTALEAIAGVEKVYFQPDQNVKLSYPCIVYERSSVNVNAAHADDIKYFQLKRYSVTVIDRNPDSAIADAVGERRYTELERFFVTDGLNHTVFQTFF
jgi:hypothetical protein